MNIFKALRVIPKPEGGTGRPTRDVLPELHSFVDIELSGDRNVSTSIDEIDAHSFTTRLLPGVHVGTTVSVSYNNSFGRYRFSTTCTGVDERHAYFDLPATVRTLVTYGSKRGAIRVACVLPVTWRYTSLGKGAGDFVKGAMTNFSRMGASLVVDHDLKAGTLVEVRFALSNSPTPLTLLGEVVRAAKIVASGKNSTGIRFLNVDGASDGIINEFIHERQKLRRQRGMV